MKRKRFLQTSSVLLAGGMLAPYMACKSEPETVPVPLKNWAGNYTYQAKNLRSPSSVQDVQTMVKNLGRQKALGSRHCFNDIADSPENQISTVLLNQILDLNEEQKTLTVGAGIRYGDFAMELDKKGYALHNLASLPHISVAGACATGTHGSGMQLGNLATPVRSIELVTPQGDILNLDRQHPDFPAVVVGLGAFGIITKVTLDIEDTYRVRQDVFQELPLTALAEHFDAIMGSGYSVSLFTNWLDQKVSQVWVKRRMDRPIDDLGHDFYGATAATRNLHPIVEITAENCTEQMGVPGPWYLRLPHFKMGFMPSGGEELQSEYYVPRVHAVDAILALEKKKDQIYPELLISEIRTIAADENWMSPCYQQDSVTIHFTWKQHDKEVRALLPMIEAELAPYGVRPHWGKLFSVNPEDLHKRYPRYPDFVALAKKYDPEGKYRNPYLDLNIYG